MKSRQAFPSARWNFVDLSLVRQKIASSIVQFAMLTFVTSAFAQIPEQNPKPSILHEHPVIQTYRVPFDSVSRMFAPGTELESIRFDEFEKMVEFIEDHSKQIGPLRQFTGSVDHNLEILEGTLTGVTRFESPPETIQTSGFRFVPGWLDSDYLANSGWKAAGNNLYVASDGKIAIAFAQRETVVKWSVPKIDAPGRVRFPVRFPQGMASRIRLNLPTAFTPSSDVGIWIPQSEVQTNPGIRTWNHSGIASPSEIRIEESSGNTGKSDDDFDADSYTEWTVSDDVWSGYFEARLRSPRSISKLRVEFTDETFVTGCQVNGIRSQFQRVDHEIIVPFESETGEPVTIRFEMKRPGSQAGEVDWPTIQPQGGRWFLSRASVIDLRKNPFVEVIDKNRVPLPITLETDENQSTKVRRLSFVTNDRISILKLRRTSSEPKSEGEVTGEYLISESGAIAALRLDLSKIDPSSVLCFRIDTPMKPVRVISYRVSEDGERSACDFEIKSSDGGFSISALPSDTSRGSLIFDILLSGKIDRKLQSDSVEFPVIRLESGRALNAKWSILSEDPLMRLHVRTARPVTWLPRPPRDFPAGLPGIKDISPGATPLASWYSDGETATDIIIERIAPSESGIERIPLTVFILDPPNRIVHSIRFENERRNSPNSNRVFDESLERAVARCSGVNGNPRIESDSSLSRQLTYRYEAFAIDELTAKTKSLSTDSPGSKGTCFFVSEKGDGYDEVVRRFPQPDRVEDHSETVAEKSVAFLKSLGLLSDRFGRSGRNLYHSKDSVEFTEFAEVFSREVAKVHYIEPISPVLTEQIELISDIASDGSATHRLRTSIAYTGTSKVRIEPGNGCHISRAKLAGVSVPIILEESGKPSGFYLKPNDGLVPFELNFTTEAGILETTGVPLGLSFADSLTVWKIRSPNELWSFADHPSDSNELRTSFEMLASRKIVRNVPPDPGFELVKFAISIGLWSVPFVALSRHTSRGIRFSFWTFLFVASCFAVIYVQSTNFSSVIAGALMCITSLSERNRKSRYPAVRNLLIILATTVILPSISAQSFPMNRNIRVALPYEKLENAFESPKRAVLDRHDLKFLRDLVEQFESQPVTTSLFSSQATHSIEPIEDDSFRIVSKYRVESSGSEIDSPANKTIIVPLATDDALQVRASLEGTEVPVRVDRMAGKVELRFDRMPAGEITITKTFLVPRPDSALKLSMFPAIGATLRNTSSAKSPPGLMARARIGDRSATVEPGSEIRFDLADELSIDFGSRKESHDSSEKNRSWFTIVRNSTGFVVLARLNDESREPRTLTFAKSARFLDASECEVSILPNSAEGSRRIRISPRQNSVRVRFWMPASETEISLGEILTMTPNSRARSSIIRLATGSGVFGDWSVLSESKRFDEDPFEIESAASEAEAMIRRSFEVSDWKSARLRFEKTDSRFEPKIESILTLEDEEVQGVFSVQATSPDESSIVRDTVVSFPNDTIVTEVSGDDLIDDIPVNDDKNARRIIFHGGRDGISRFEIRTRTKISPPQTVDSSIAESRAVLPWPRFDSDPLAAGKLIVDRRIDPDSSFRMSPMKSDNSLFENRGEIRTPDTPADLRRWLYQFRGSEVPPSISWQIPGVFSHVLVEQEVDVVRDVPKWNCRIQYEPQDGPLSIIMFEINHGVEIDPIVETDNPKFWKIERTNDSGKTRFRLLATSPTFGRSTIKLRNGNDSHAANRFDLPNVTPLGHGKVDKSVTLRTSSNGQNLPFEIESRGLVESPSTNPGPIANGTLRNWRFRAPDASLSLIFANQGEQSNQASDTNGAVESTLIRNLAFEITDDGEVLWYGTVDSVRMRSQGIPFSDELGRLSATNSKGWPISLDRKDGRFVITDRDRFDKVHEILLSGRFRIDRLPIFFASIQGTPLPHHSNSIFFALRGGGHSRMSPPGKKSSAAEWLKSGQSPFVANSSHMMESIETERIKHFQSAGFAISSSNRLTTTDSKLGNSNLDRPIPDRSIRFATDYIDDRILVSPSHWNFYEFDPASLSTFVRNASTLDSKSESHDDDIRRGMIATVMTMAVWIFTWTRPLRADR